MNTRITTSAIALVLAAFAMPAFAADPNQFGVPTSPYTYGYNGYGYNIPPYNPVVTADSYGAGFIPSPVFLPSYGAPQIRTAANYGAGFIPSPTFVGGGYGYARPAFYGAGFIPSPRPWYGNGSLFRLLSFF